MSAYETLAVSYDRLTNDVPYRHILTFAQRLLTERGISPRSVLDLACGTGAMSLLLAEAGYRVIGVDMSEEMLTMAAEKAMSLRENRPFFVRQKMQRLRLPEPVDWVFSGLDINTPIKLRAMDGQIFLDEDDDVYCVWRGEFDESTKICTYGMDIFQRRGKHWMRSQEEHLEYAYEPEQLITWLTEAGFRHIQCFGDLRPEAPRVDEQRIYFLAIKENEE